MAALQVLEELGIERLERGLDGPLSGQQREHRFDRRHDEAAASALAGHVRHHQTESAVGQREDIEEITGHVGRWEEDFERRFGFWRGSIEEVLYAFLDCGVFDRGFARVRCPACRAERLFRHKVITLLRDEDLLTEERIELLLWWRHSGFSAHNAVIVPPGDREGIERLARYLLRAPVPLERLRVDPRTRSVHYRPKGAHPRPAENTFEASEFLARLLLHVPEPRLHQVRYYGYYSNVARARRAEGEGGREVLPGPEATEPKAAERRRLRRSWAQMIRRIYEVDPLTCVECGSEMRILAFLLAPAVVRKILDHLDKRPDRTRAPPAPAFVATAEVR